MEAVNNVSSIKKWFNTVWSTIFPNVKKIAIVGMKGSGKSTLWKGLGGKGDKEVSANTSQETIHEFKYKKQDGTIVTIASTKDIGGENDYVCIYDELITEDCLIFYLADTNGIFDDPPVPSPQDTPLVYSGRVRSDLTKIDKCLNNKSEDKFRIEVLLTHFGSFQKKHPDITEEEVKSLFYKKIQTLKSSGPVGTLIQEKNLPVRVIELTKNPRRRPTTQAKIDTKQINLIKEEIGLSKRKK